MYYASHTSSELGFDAFIAPDDFNRFIQPVDIYEVFKREYALNNQARYIYYYSDGNYPLTLTPSATEYFRYGYTQGGVDVIVDVPLNGTAVSIFGETLTTKRWVCVYRVSTAKFSLSISIAMMEWLYCGNYINEVKRNVSTMVLKYVHFASINSITGNFDRAFNVDGQTPCIGTITIPETVISFGASCFSWTGITKVNMPKTKDIQHTIGVPGNTFPTQGTVEYNFGASTSLGSVSARDQYINLRVLSVSSQNTLYSSLNNCDIIFNKAQDTIVWVAPKTVRGICLPDTLPQAQVDALGTKLSANLMANHQLYIGTLITNITNLYLANKKFVTVDCSVDNQNYLSENNILYNKTKTQLVKCGTSNTGNLVIQNTVVGIDSGAFNGCTNLTGKLTIGSSLTSIAANSINQLTNVTELEFVAPFDTAIWSAWSFATFTGESIYNAIQMLVDGTAGNVKNFYINQATMDNLLAYNSGAVVAAAARFINVVVFIRGNKLSLDAGNPASYPGTGTVWTDLSGSGNNGTLINGVAYSTANGGVMSFDGVNDRVQIANSTSLGFGGDITITTALKRVSNSANTEEVFIQRENGGTSPNGGYQMWIDRATLKIKIRIRNTANQSYTHTSNNAIQNNLWNIISFVRIGSDIFLYVNGILDSSSTSSVLIGSTILPLGIGGHVTASGYVFNGQLNNIDIYDYGFTPEQANSNFQALRTKYGI